MAPELEKEYCCCQMFPITQGVYLLALHCVLQALYAVGLVMTSHYKSKDDGVIYSTVGSNLCLVPTGILIFWANLYESWKGTRVSGFLLLLVAIFNSITATLYFFWFIHFRANSELDKDIFWRNDSDWITSSDLPFTIWHGLTFLLIIVNSLWFYYSRVLCRFSIFLKAKKK